MLKITTKKLFFVLFLSMLQIACTNNDNTEELIDDEQNELKISFEINNTPISITYPRTKNSGSGIAISKIHNSNNLLLSQVSETYFNEEYKINLYFTEYFSSDEYNFSSNENNLLKLPWEDFKHVMFNTKELGIKYIDYKGNNNTYLPGKSYKGFTIEITDLKNNKTYTSKLLDHLYTEDTNNKYEYTNFTSNSYFEFINAEALPDDSSGFNKNYKIEANFECYLLDYSKKIDGEVVVNDFIKLTNGKIIGAL